MRRTPRAPRTVDPTARDALRFGILGCVYEGTDPDHFRATAASIRAQTHVAWEWVLLCQGDLSPELRTQLDDLTRHEPRLRRLDSAHNLGIMRGLRRCLEHSTARYVIPVDTDDLITPRALATIAEHAIAHDLPDLLFSDEDVLIDGQHVNPYRRPGYDPALNWSTSYIWHACAFDRVRALALDVFGDHASEMCQDWDTLRRFADAAARLVHVPEVLYHWRLHRRSQTNQDAPNPASVTSQHNVLQQSLARRSLQDLAEVVPFPIARGGPTEWWLQHRKQRTLDLRVILAISPDARATDRPWAAELANRLRAFAATEPDTLHLHIEVVEDARAWSLLGDARAREARPEQTAGRAATPALTVWLAAGTTPRDFEWIWEAGLWPHLLDDFGLLSPRILDAHGKVVDGGGIFGIGRFADDPFAGLAASDAGHYALALKHRTVSTVPSTFFIANDALLARPEVRRLLAQTDLTTLGPELGLLAAELGSRVVQSPLVDAIAQDLTRLARPRDAELRRLVRRLQRLELSPVPADAYRAMLGLTATLRRLPQWFGRRWRRLRSTSSRPG